uniref:Uncharacterized protein n=1 Tax=Leersia perrieri TaxID=77586 RepID=A0A0D9WPS0_9ORYZ
MQDSSPKPMNLRGRTSNHTSNQQEGQELRIRSGEVDTMVVVDMDMVVGMVEDMAILDTEVGMLEDTAIQGMAASNILADTVCYEGLHKGDTQDGRPTRSLAGEGHSCHNCCR